jgi:hypothetical protein
MVPGSLVVVAEHLRPVADQGRRVDEIWEPPLEDRPHRLEVEAARELETFQSSAFIVTVPSFSSTAWKP